MVDQIIVFSILFLALVFFVVEKWRYDMVALLALLAVVVTGIVSPQQAFTGFAHPAVVTVAAVLVVSRGLHNSGVVDVISRLLSKVGDRPVVQLLTLTGFVTICSGLMNNVGAMVLLMPVAIKMARKSGHPPSIFLMPLAFGSLLGGLTTLIGTPPNIIIATFRVENGAGPFRMFDFLPVGGGVALAGLLFISLVGWRFIPKRAGPSTKEDLFFLDEYITEVVVSEECKLAGKSLRELEKLTEADVTVLGIIRGSQHIAAPPSYEIVRVGDVLVVEADPGELQSLVETTNLMLAAHQEKGQEVLKSEEVSITECVIKPNSVMLGLNVRSLHLRWRYGMNLLAVSRHGERFQTRLSRILFRAGDVLLLQGRTDTMQEALADLGCLPLAERGLRLGQKRRVFVGLGTFALALGISAAGVLPVQITFVAAALAMIFIGLISIREVYDSIDWPVIVLLGAMIPVGQALENTGGSKLIADTILRMAEQLPPAATLAALLIGTVLLSNIINNAAAAILMAPIAISVAKGLGASPDPFLMGVAIGASCAFLTPIGHQSNTLVMEPGGYRFGDYWRMGLPLEIVIFVVALPLILWFWPLNIVTR